MMEGCSGFFNFSASPALKKVGALKMMELAK